MRIWRAAVPLLVAAMVAAACGGDDGDGDAQGRDALAEGDAIEAAEDWLDDWDRLGDDVRESLELAGTRRSPGVTHVRYTQSFDGTPVRDALAIVHVRDDSSVLGASDALTDARPPADVEQDIDEQEARSIAEGAAGEDVRDTLSARIVWLPHGSQLRLGWSVQMTVARGGFQAWVDAVTGEVADTRRLVYDERLQDFDDCEADEDDAPVACILEPDPLRADELTDVELQGLDDGDGESLIGEFADTEAGELFGIDAVTDDDGVWDLAPGDEGFEQAMAYVWIDRAQRYVQQLGFDDVQAAPLGVAPRFEDEVDNAFFSPPDELMVLGVSSGGPSVAEDASVILHEYGHAMLFSQVPFLGANPEFDAYHEAFGDIFAMTMLANVADDPACVGPWLAANIDIPGVDIGECIRRTDGDRVYPDDIVGEPHTDGEIHTGAVFDILEGLLEQEDLTIEDCAGRRDCNEVLDRVTTTVLAANGFLTGAETLPGIAAAYQAANEAVFDGEDADLIEAAFDDHGLGGGGAVLTDAAGDKPDLPADAVTVSFEITHTFVGDLRVLVGVVDDDGEELCDTISLLQPTGRPGRDRNATFDISDTDCAELGPPGSGRTWALVVVDEADIDVGRIESFRVRFGREEFLADSVPVNIPDNDPSGSVALVSG
ncbi:MAG: hypothetical protein ACRD0G_17620 [Acidimicrobiales bacterium]